MKENPFGRTSTLHLMASVSERGSQNGRAETYLKEMSFTAPYKVLSPFKREDGSIEVMILAVSAGIMEGDTQQIMLETEPGAVMECTSQSFEKIHKMNEGCAKRETQIRVADSSMLVYRPLPVIPFAQSDFRSRTEIHLAGAQSRMIYQEILSCGRSASGERFAYRRYDARIQVRRDGKLIYRENCRFDPDRYEMEAVGMFEGHSHLANLLLFGMKVDEEKKNQIRGMFENDPEICGGLSMTAYGDTVIRIFGDRAQKLQEVCEEICKNFSKKMDTDCLQETGETYKDK